MKVAFYFFAKDIFDIEDILINAEIVFHRAAKAGATFVFTENSFIDRLARYEVPTKATIELISKRPFKPYGVDKVINHTDIDYSVYIFNTPTPPHMEGKRLIINLTRGTEQWILD